MTYDYGRLEPALALLGVDSGKCIPVLEKPARTLAIGQLTGVATRWGEVSLRLPRRSRSSLGVIAAPGK